MPTAVTDYTLPARVEPVVAVTTTALKTETKAETTTMLTTNKNTAKALSNGIAMQLQGEHRPQQQQQQQQHQQLQKITAKEANTDTDNSNNNVEKQQFIVKYRHRYYDIGRFLKNHPGGVNTLRGLRDGGDITSHFQHAPPHSDAAMYLMKEYEIRISSSRRQLSTQPFPTTIQTTQLQNGLKHRQYCTPPLNDEDNPSTMGLMIVGVGDSGERRQEEGAEEEVEKDDSVQQQQMFKEIEDKNNNQLDESMEHLVDWSKAMAPQISRITRYYDEWVHKPVDRPLRLFGPTYFEVFTKTPWWVIPLFWLPIISKCLWDEYTQNWRSATKSELYVFVLYLIGGLLFWSLLEYILHRFVFHMKLNANTNPWLCTFHFLIHGLHHKVPFDSKRLVFPPLPGVIVATAIYTPLTFVLPHPRIVLAGALLGYLCYDLMHYYLHYGNPSLKRARFMYHMKRYHYQHHFAHQDMGFGLSSPLWDIVFGTRIHLRKLRYPLRWR